MKFQITANVDTVIVPDPEAIAKALPPAFQQMDPTLTVEAVHVTMTPAGFVATSTDQPPGVP